MANRRSRHSTLCGVLLLGAVLSMGAGSYRTRNFVVEAPTQQIAEQVGQYAEHYRKEKAKEWLGYEMPPWGRPCPLKVTVTMGGSGGATSFVFDRGQILDQDMRIEGRLDRILASVLPHEVTHTVFAFYYRRPVPRWADEGGSVLSEDQLERSRHDQLVRQILSTRGRSMPLRRLFNLRNYPSDVMVLYAQGYSVTNFLVSRSSRPKFLNFLGDGMRRGWDTALRQHYGYRNVEELEEAWIQHLRRSQPEPSTMVAGNNRPQPVARSQPQARLRMSEEVVVRQTTPPVPPLLTYDEPVVRGQSGGEDNPGYEQPFRPTSQMRPQGGYAPGMPMGRCGPNGCPPPQNVQPLPPRYAPDGGRPPRVSLGAPQPYGSYPPGPSPQYPIVGSPVGYPR